MSYVSTIQNWLSMRVPGVKAAGFNELQVPGRGGSGAPQRTLTPVMSSPAQASMVAGFTNSSSVPGALVPTNGTTPNAAGVLSQLSQNQPIQQPHGQPVQGKGDLASIFHCTQPPICTSGSTPKSYPKPESLSTDNGATKMAEEADNDHRPYRERVEVFGLRGGKLLGGYYTDDKTHGVFGGGIDKGDTPLRAAVREYMEEAGLPLKKPRLLDIPAVTSEWKPPFSSPILAERAKKYRGSRTSFVVGDVPDVEQRTEGLEPSNLTNVRFRSLPTAYCKTTPSTAQVPELAAARRAAIRALMQN